MRLATTVRAARADQLHRFLCDHGSDCLEAIRLEVADMTRSELHRALDDLVAEDPPRAFIESLGGWSIHVGALIYDDPDIAEAA